MQSVALQSEMQPLRSHTLHLQVRESSAGFPAKDTTNFPNIQGYPRFNICWISLATRQTSNEFGSALAAWRFLSVCVSMSKSDEPKAEPCLHGLCWGEDALRGTSLKELREACSQSVRHFVRHGIHPKWSFGTQWGLLLRPITLYASALCSRSEQSDSQHVRYWTWINSVKPYVRYGVTIGTIRQPFLRTRLESCMLRNRSKWCINIEL